MIKKQRTKEEQLRLDELSSRGVQSTFPVRPETKEAPQAVRVQMAPAPAPSAYSGAYPGSQTASGTPSALRIQKVEPRQSYPVYQQPTPQPAAQPAVEAEPQVLTQNGPMRATVRPAAPMEEEIRQAFSQVRPTTEPSLPPIIDLGVVLGQRSVRGLGTLQALLLSTVWPRHAVLMGDTVPGDWPGVQVQRMAMPPTPWARFLFAAHMLPTEYVLIIDDDAVPASGWIEAAVKHVEQNPDDIVSISGLVRGDGDYELDKVVGPGAEPSETAIVNVGKQGWLLKRARLAEILTKTKEQPADLGWDLHLSRCDAKGRTVVLPYTKATAGTTQAPVKDEHSLSNAADYAKRRDAFEDLYVAREG